MHAERPLRLSKSRQQQKPDQESKPIILPVLFSEDSAISITLPLLPKVLKHVKVQLKEELTVKGKE